jgi:hypothetical protein
MGGGADFVDTKTVQRALAALKDEAEGFFPASPVPEVHGLEHKPCAFGISSFLLCCWPSSPPG